MERFWIRLLGPPRIEVDNRAVDVRTRKELALLAYLAVGSRHRHRRDSLVGLLWPNATDTAGRNNLRVVLATLRRQLGDGAGDTLVANRQTVHLEVGELTTVDVTTYRRLIDATRSHDHASIEGCATCTASLTQAVDQYHGSFLQGLSLPDCVEFEEWMTVQREQLHLAQLSSLDTLARAAAARGDHPTRAELGRRQLALEPWREAAHAHVIAALAALGERGAALAQYDACRRVLDDELGLAPSPELTALAEQIRSTTAPVFDPTMPHRHPGDERRLVTSVVRRHDLPAPLTPLVGRVDELATVGRLLDDGHRLISVIGPGGAGKSSLAQAVGREVSARADQRVWWVPLAGVDPSDDPADQRRTLVGVIATSLGYVLSGKEDALFELGEIIGDGASLLVLDNCEHLPHIGLLARALLEGSPGLRVVATSREPLGLPGERLVRLEGLAVPPVGARDAGEYASVQLFLDRAERRSPGWATAGQEAAIARLCRIVDGLPLAIELAVGWVGHFSVEDIATQVEIDVDFLAAQGDRSDRHSSLRSVFEYSWRALDPEAQQALARLSVLRAGFDRDTAREVAEVAPAALTTLVDKSLVRNVAPGRYSTHELVRQLAAERLDADGSAERWQARHASVFLRLAELARPELGGADQARWLDRLHAAVDDLRAALGWAEARSDTDLGLRLCAALWPFWQRRCQFAEGRSWLERFLTGDQGDVDPVVRADVLHGAGWLCHDQDDFARAEAFFAAGLAVDESLGRTDRVAWVMAHRGVMARDRGDYSRAVTLLEGSVSIARSSNDVAGVAYGLFRLGVVSREHGNVERAVQASDEAVRIYRALGDRVGEAFALLVKSDIARDDGDPLALRRWSADSLEIGRAFDHSWVTGFALNNMALAALMLGELAEADALAAEALALFRSHGVRGGEVEMLITKGRIELAAGQIETGRDTLVEGVRSGLEHGPHWLAATGVEDLAGQFDDPRQTVRLLAAADAWRAAMGAPLPPARRPIVEAMLDRARDLIGQSAVLDAWDEGAAWSPERAVAEACSGEWSQPAAQVMAASKIDQPLPLANGGAS